MSFLNKNSNLLNFVLFFAVFGFSILINAQINFNTNKLTEITYETSYNEQKQENQNPVQVLTDGANFLISTKDGLNQKSNYPFEISIVNTINKSYRQISFLNSAESVATDDFSSIAKQEFEFSNESQTILGFNCKKAKTVINSNTIEIWYTTDKKIKASPYILGADLGLVLKVVRNGNYIIEATAIKKNADAPAFVLNSKPEILERIDYQDKIWKARFTTLEIFKNQPINFSDEFEPKEGIMRFANGTIAVKKEKFPKISGSSQVFVNLTEQSNGDAYDRTGSIFLIPVNKKQSFLDGLEKGVDNLPLYENGNGNGKKYRGITATPEYEPLLELMRFFTPFGVKHFNERVTLKNKQWQDSVYYRQEISDFGSVLSEKEVYIGAFIGNYDKGGHLISMDITVHNDEDLNHPLKKVIPLFNTLNVMEMAGQEYSTLFDSEKGLEVEFELTQDLKNAQLRYITTGHGGWGNGDEFVQRKNTILLDDKVIFDLIPWREDCGSYRLYNPVSGNFSNGLSSSDYSRSNWCPGTVTNPFLIDLGDLKAGKHKIKVLIPQGKPEGSSFSAWNVSGVLVGD